MDYEKIKELIECMGKSALTSLDIESPDGLKMSMKKEVAAAVSVVPSNVDVVTKNEIKIVSEEVKEEVVEGNIVKAPMVGTFYLKPAPDASPYVNVGEIVNKGTTLCIIEAMKLMNEIESEYDGKIAEVYVKDGEAVEYGKPLFRIV